MLKRAVLILACVGLSATACSDSLDTGAADVTTDVTTGAPPVTTAATPPVATEAPTTPPSTTSPAAAASATAAPLVPEVVCVGDDFTVHFAYDNQGDDVVVADGSDNTLRGSDPDDEPFVPTVFAPGRSAAVFYAQPVGEPSVVTWELTGPDGETRTASATADTPNCAEVADRAASDPRTPALEVTSATLDEATDELTVTIELTGVPTVSVCNTAFDPEPAIIRLEDSGGEVLADGTSVTLTRTVFDFSSIGRAASFDVSAVVIDRCTYEGITFSSWPTGEFVSLYDAPTICVSVEGTEPEVIDDDCSDLPSTGGSKIRNG